MWSGKKKKGTAEDFFKEEELDLELSGGRKRDKDKEEKEKRKKEKDEKKKTKDEEAAAAKDSAHGGVGLFQRKHKKSVGSSDIDALRKERDREKEKEKEKEKSGPGRVFHRRNKSSSSGDPTAAAVVASAASRLNVLGGSNPDREVTRLGIKRETLSPPGTLNLSSGLLSSFPPPTTSPRNGNSPRNPLGNSAGAHSGPMAPLPQLADISHKRKNSVDEVSPRFDGSPMRGLADMKQPIPISELLKRSPITSPRSPVLGREMTEQQRQILAQAKKKLQLELVRDNIALVDRGPDRYPTHPSSSEDVEREIATVIEEWEDDREADRKRSLRDKREEEEWERERRAKLAHLARSSEPTSALGQYLITRWKDQPHRQSTE